MIRIDFDPAALTGEARVWWDSWAARAARKMKEYLEKREKDEACELDPNVWAELKVWLLEHVFHGKCAYCETKVLPGAFGDAEHYRPKGNVTIIDPNGKRCVTLASGEAHRGYYWLAYDPRNLLPACGRCNNVKSDQFEIEGDYVDAPPADTDSLNQSERPLLLYPYVDEPSKFLRFGSAGVVTAINGNARGLATIRMLGLDRKDLADARWDVQGKAVRAMANDVGRLMIDDRALDEVAESHMGPKEPYSRAVHDWFRESLRLIGAKAEAIAARVQQTR